MPTGSPVLNAGYAVTSEFERTHWWFRSRRDAVFAQADKAVRELGRKAKLRIMDFGCGTGFNLDLLEKYGDVVGADRYVDKVGEFPAVKKRTLLDLNGDVSSHLGRYDLVTALDVLEHTEDDVQALNLIADFLKKDGRLILTVPAYDWLWSGEDEISLHKRRYTRTRLLAAVEKTDFDVLFMSYFNLTVLPAMAAVISWTKLTDSDWRSKSSVGPTPRFINEFLAAVTGLENRLVGNEIISVPAGASLICRLRKK